MRPPSHRIPALRFPAILFILLILSPTPSLLAQSTGPDPTMVAGEPDPREIPVPPIKTNLARLPGPAALPAQTALPDPLLKSDGTRIASAEAWKNHRTEIRHTLEYYAVGAMPPAPGNVKGRVISSRPVLDGFANYRLVHLTFGPGEKLSLNIGIFTPASPANTAFPVVIFPGGTPPGATPLPALPRPPGQGKGVNALLPLELSTPTAPTPTTATTQPSTNAPAPSASTSRHPSLAATGGNPAAPKPSEAADPEAVAARIRPILARGYAYITFNNNDCAEDTTLRLPDGSWAFRTTRFYPAYPGYDWGILGGWAWGVSRIVDYIEIDSSLDASKTIVSGISRTGKSALIAAAFDERIALAAPVVTGGGGVGAYRFSGEGRGGKEGLDLMMKKYPNWFSPHLHPFRGETDKLPFDQHWFLALIAPRPFIALEGTTDGVSLLNAVKQSWLAAQPVYALFDATDKLGVNYANHGHTITDDDWTAMLDFADQHLNGRKISRRFNQFPVSLAKDILDPTPTSRRIELWNGRDLHGWEFHWSDPAPAADSAWSITDRELHLHTTVRGYLRTQDTYKNYHLHLEWSWLPGTPPTRNSGVLVHVNGPDAIWPASYETQLMSGLAGQIIALGGAGLPGLPIVNQLGRAQKLAPSSEHAPGEWNSADILCIGDTLEIFINGVRQNAVTNLPITGGAIALQAEGAPIAFRNLWLEPRQPAPASQP